MSEEIDSDQRIELKTGFHTPSIIVSLFASMAVAYAGLNFLGPLGIALWSAGSLTAVFGSGLLILSVIGPLLLLFAGLIIIQTECPECEQSVQSHRISGETICQHCGIKLWKADGRFYFFEE
ncbi:hypothetical protein ACFL35_07315 [Candidatus Riflebacteria bacterium]